MLARVDEPQAEDLVQETFVRALRHAEVLARLTPEQRRAWLVTTLKRLFFDSSARAQSAQKAQKAQKAQEMALNGFFESGPESEGAGEMWMSLPAGTAQHTLNRVLAGQALKLVPLPDRALVAWSLCSEMTSREIGEQLGVPAGTVRARLHEALGRLRVRLGVEMNETRSANEATQDKDRVIGKAQKNISTQKGHKQ